MSWFKKTIDNLPYRSDKVMVEDDSPFAGKVFDEGVVKIHFVEKYLNNQLTLEVVSEDGVMDGSPNDIANIS